MIDKIISITIINRQAFQFAIGVWFRGAGAVPGAVIGGSMSGTAFGEWLVNLFY